MMDHIQLISGGGEENVGIPDDLRCKRSDGKQWRCTAMSMPDKTVCEKHYTQAKKRAANSAIRVTVKKIKRRSIGESDVYLESKSDDTDLPISSQFGDHSISFSGKKKKEKSSKPQHDYSPEMPLAKSFSARTSARLSDDLDIDGSGYENNRSYRTPPTSAMDSSRGRPQKMFETSPMMETSEESSKASDDNGGKPCHQCRNSVREGVMWCLKCEKRGYCKNCISTWYSDFPVEEIQRVCPACRGTCSCQVCLRGDNLIKARIREIPARDKLQYLYRLLSAVFPVVKRIHSVQCSEVELEKKLWGNEIDLSRIKVNPDEQMCCDFCRIPIIDYHRHCPNCSYDLCLSCCKDIREASMPSVKGEVNHIGGRSDDQVKAEAPKHVKLSDVQLNSFAKLTDWKARIDGGIPCPPKEHGGCSSPLLILKRIFKMNWVAKLVKNVEEMVNGCQIHNSINPDKSVFDLSLYQAARHDNDNDNFLYYPSSQDVKNEGVKNFRLHWSKGKPVIVKEVCDASAMTIWDPMIIWRGIKDTKEEKMKGADIVVKAVDCNDWTEINIILKEFMKGYYDGRVRENGLPQMLKLKNWPSPTSSEEFLLYQRSNFLSKLPLLEFIHSKWGLLNVAAKLPHYSLQTDVGPKIFISYGAVEETGQGDSTNNLHLSMRDMVFLLVHTCEVKLKGTQNTMDDIQKAPIHSGSSTSEMKPDGSEANHSKNHEKCDDQGIVKSQFTEEKNDNHSENRDGGNILEKTLAGALWDVFRQQDIPKLIEYISIHRKDLGKANNVVDNFVYRSLYDGEVYLNLRHKRKLKEEFGVEPWSFEQHIGEAIFIPVGCPFQVRHLQSSVQLGLDFLSPESLAETVRLSQEIRGLPNDHDMKLQILEVGKISLYAASSAIKEIKKLVLDPIIRPELGFEDPNLTSLVSKNLENMVKQRQITCASA